MRLPLYSRSASFTYHHRCSVDLERARIPGWVASRGQEGHEGGAEEAVAMHVSPVLP
jgi:hypothetical protein